MLLRRRGRIGHVGARPSLTAWVASVFSGGVPGTALIPLPQYCFVDAVGGTPATVGGESGTIIVQDLSGNGKHATFSNAVLTQDGSRYYIALNGTTTGGVTDAIDFTGTDEATIWAGVHKASDAAIGLIVELGANSSATAGTFALLGPNAAAAANYGARFRGSIAPPISPAGPLAAPITSLLTVQGKISTDTNILRINGADASTNANDQGSGNLGNYPLYIGRRGGSTLPFNGRLYGLIVTGKLGAGMLLDGERYMNRLTGL